MSIILCWLAHVFLYETLLSVGNNIFYRREWNWWYKNGLLDKWRDRICSGFISGITWSFLMFAVCYFYDHPANLNKELGIIMILGTSLLQLGLGIVKISPAVYQVINCLFVVWFGITFKLLFE